MANDILLKAFEAYQREYNGCETQEQIDREMDKFCHCHDLVINELNK